LVRIAVLDDYEASAETMADWSGLGPQARVTFHPDHEADEERLVQRLHDVQIVVAIRERTAFPGSLLRRLPNLELLVLTGRRHANLDEQAAAELDIAIARTEGLTHPAAELAWALLMALARSIAENDAGMRKGEWGGRLGESIQGKTLGLLGLGRTGQLMATYGQAFGAEVIAWSKNLTAEAAGSLGVRAVSKEDLFRSSDFVSVHLRLSDRTEDLVGVQEFAHMKPSAYLINTSRGPIVNESALMEALDQGIIAGAAMDVYDIEPPAADHPLRRSKRVLLSPHVGYVTRDTFEIFFSDAVEKIRAHLASRATP
jgi:phosphoglycerate dehydrogenase-like enzyme